MRGEDSLELQEMCIWGTQAGGVALRRQMLGEPHNSLWVMARGKASFKH